MNESTSPENLQILEELYRKFQSDINTIDSSWQKEFANLIDRSQSSFTSSEFRSAEKSTSFDLRIHSLIEAYRTFGHLYVKNNPIALVPPDKPPQLDLHILGFSESDLDTQFLSSDQFNNSSLREIIRSLEEIYCHKIGIEYTFIENKNIKDWLQEHIETTQFKSRLTIDQKKMILDQLNKSELFETFIHTKYTGQKRFSLEGAETLIPMLESAVEKGSQLGLDQFVIGMAHRGRLNVLSNILRKSYQDIFSEFEEGYVQNSFEGSGDVKYHKGFSSKIVTPEGEVEILLPPNPSHLESVNPVVEGMVKARQDLLNDKEQTQAIPILIHGDSAITGQGIVYETAEMCRLKGYSTGGTINIIINNQIGFTAVPSESRSTRYCTDIGRAFDAPIFHVNAEDPEGCVYVTNLALEIRQKFHCDVFIDLVCYRKYGHNESDEPAYTQPLEYQIIRKKKPIREIYRDQLINEGIVEKEIAESLEKEFTDSLQKAMEQSKGSSATPKKVQKENSCDLKDIFEVVKTSVSAQILKEIAEKISAVPDTFSIHPKLQQLVKQRFSMVSEEEKAKPIDWGMAELLAYGSLLWEGTHIRLSGQDSRRGTFSHRHAIWMDQVVEDAYCPLNHLKTNQGKFDVINSHLSEYGVVGFEFGYSCAYPGALVLWEAQFGDFSNGAQIMIDQYISTAEQKWGQKFGLVLLLPHGYEGQGPEHSSGRIERFLTLCGNDNMRIVNPTTPAQFFHLLRRQILHPILKPLVVFTPKGLLRHPACVSRLTDLTEGIFQEVLDDPLKNTNITRLAFCSGRIYYDLIAQREQSKADNLAIVRIEQLYPLHIEKLQAILKHCEQAKEFYWVQEEPRNMGAWGFIQPQIEELLPAGVKMKYIGRKRSASPAAGSYAIHKQQHAEILEELFKC